MPTSWFQISIQNMSSLLKLVLSSLSKKHHIFQPQIQACSFSNKLTKSDEIPKNLLAEVHSATEQLECGIIYDRKPFKMRCVKGKKYSWCLCGRSKNQPLCDGSHKSPYIKITQRPVRFEVSEDKEYWLCNCKQTSNRPFCDGTHKREDIQAAIKH